MMYRGLLIFNIVIYLELVILLLDFTPFDFG